MKRWKSGGNMKNERIPEWAIIGLAQALFEYTIKGAKT
jgi:hypothetical protein